MKFNDIAVFQPNVLHRTKEGYLEGRIRVTGAGAFVTPESKGAVRLPPFFGAFLYGNCHFWTFLCTESSLFGTETCRKRPFLELFGW